MKFQVEVKDELVPAYGAEFGNPDNPTEAIQAKLDSVILEPLERILKNHDPEVLALTEARNQKLNEKVSAAKGKG